MHTNMSKYDLFKWRLYLWSYPIIIAALCSNVLQWQNYSNLMKSIIIFLIIWNTVAWFLLFKRKYFKTVEIISLCIISITYLFVYERVLSQLNVSAYLSMELLFWTPLIFIYIFIVLKGKKGFIYALTLWIITLCVHMFYSLDLPNEVNYSYIQFHFSSIMYITFLLFSQVIFRSFIESEVIEKYAFKDFLTGINNRRMMYSYLKSEIKNKKELTVIFFDIDHFKKINDQHGHFIGDEILKEVTNVVLTRLTKNETFGRWGGEEFIIVSKGTGLENTITLAEEIRKTIKDHSFTNKLQVTCSFGVKQFQYNDTLNSFLSEADKALYLAKENGRNKVEVTK
ncbi:GGDEF domain-containing protein [Evansella cellulosilytica]|uniref:Diguanylate cyclase n=1 Tax=Evansella cellulosilytica (strain ATCC 21833 / DSM 2522 / FERM P-1141 / JCM 9156 / N-4) TaxID=649639 RepID=E6U1N1_EVAC2|nr:GGDEF domain-containing protein [Evansella cellulosilytica]ADU30394.1 diguanylate cyclase [Evansella cellulosilytica DSM 2522]